VSAIIIEAVDAAVEELVPLVGAKDACAAVGLPRASYYRARAATQPAPAEPPDAEPAAAAAPPSSSPCPSPSSSPVPSPSSQAVRARRPQVQPRALSDAERAAVLEALHSERFADAAPATVYATLLDEGTYLCSESTMYRLLRERGETGDRRRQATHPAKVKPELVATRPNECWSWDITKLRGPAKWTYYYLYVILDIFSRYPVGWMVASRESADLAEVLISQTIRKQNVDRNQLTLHADRGSSMASKPVALLLADLGVTKSHSRPHCSNDNPFSEAQFKTLKYRPDFPEKFDSIEEARVFCAGFFTWYSHEHRHSGIGLHTPADVHHGRAHAIREARGRVLDAAYLATPERFVRKPPQPPALPGTVWINKPDDKEEPAR
jgi:putative transposase